MYSATEDAHRWVLPLVLEEQAQVHGDRPFISIVEGDTITYGDLRDQAVQVASMLKHLGSDPGDRIAIMLPNGLDFIRAWAGVGRLGCVAVMLNAELTRSFLSHPLADSQSKLLIIHSSYLPRLDDLGSALASIEKIIVAGDAQSLPMGYVAFETRHHAL